MHYDMIIEDYFQSFKSSELDGGCSTLEYSASELVGAAGRGNEQIRSGHWKDKASGQ